MVELVFPCTCACGKRGHFVVGLHVLLFGYLLANVAFVKASGRGSGRSMTVYPASSKTVGKLLDDFDGVIAKYIQSAEERELTEEDRRKLGLSDEEWEQFRRRMEQ